MSELSTLAGGANSTVLPGYVLARFRAKDYAEVEEEFVIQYLTTMGKAAAKLPEKAGELLTSKAAAAVAAGHLAHGSMEYALRCFAEIWLPFLLWVALKIKHPQTTKDEAEKLITEENRDLVHDAVLECMRYKRKSPNAQGAATADGTNPPPTPGNESTPSSESAGSTTAPSEK